MDRNVVMVHAREPDVWNDERAEQIDLVSAKRFYVTAHLEGHADAEVADAQMLADFRDVLVEHADVRFFGARADAAVVAPFALYPLPPRARGPGGGPPGGRPPGRGSPPPGGPVPPSSSGAPTRRTGRSTCTRSSAS